MLKKNNCSGSYFYVILLDKTAEISYICISFLVSSLFSVTNLENPIFGQENSGF